MIIAIDGPSELASRPCPNRSRRRLASTASTRARCTEALRGMRSSMVSRLRILPLWAKSRASVRFRFLMSRQSAPKQVFIDGVDVTGDIRTARIDRSVSSASKHPEVREALVEQQRRIGSQGDYVVEGRDIGTVVFPQAEVKVFLTASNEERARRRVAQNETRGVGSVDFDEVLADIVRRDELDSARETSPLVAAADAKCIDSTGFTIDEIIEQICAMARAAGANA